MFSTCQFVRPLSNFNCEHRISKTIEPIFMQIGARGRRAKGMKRSALGLGMKVKGQDHTRPKLDLETHHSRPT